MKKLFLVLAVASLGFVACNNDASTEDAAKKATEDSTRVADSLKRVSDDAASAAAMLETKRIADSTHIADSLAALKPAPKK